MATKYVSVVLAPMLGRLEAAGHVPVVLTLVSRCARDRDTSNPGVAVRVAGGGARARGTDVGRVVVIVELKCVMAL